MNSAVMTQCEQLRPAAKYHRLPYFYLFYLFLQFLADTIVMSMWHEKSSIVTAITG